MILVSVIVPTRNSESTLEACLRSILGQTHRDLELLVVDNASSDRSPDVARRYADVFIQAGPERSAQRNCGAGLAKGDYLLFIDSDMVLDPEVVASCLATIQSVDAPAVIVPEVTMGDGFWARCRALERSCYVGDDLIEAARFFKRTSFVESGGFDEDLTGPEDWDLTARIRAGSRLPRSAVNVYHDESNLRLRGHLAKKRYYAASFRAYWRKHPSIALRQSNLVLRLALLKNWRRLVQHPVLASGVVLLKLMEMGAAGIGAAETVLKSATPGHMRD